MAEKNNKLSFISYAYAIGAMLVVLGHCTPTGASDMPLFIDSVRTFIYCFHMPLFFFIAGLLFKYTTDFNKKPYIKFIKNKAIRFLTPYFAVAFIGFIPKILFSEYVNDEVSFSFYYLIEAVFNPRLNVWGHFWFLPTLLTIFSLSYVFLKCYEKRPMYYILTAISLLIAVFPIQTDWFAIKDICLNLIYFCLGILFCDIIVKHRNKIFRLPVAIAAVVLSVIIFYIRLHSNIVCIKNMIAVAIACLMMYAIFYISVLLESKGCKILAYLDGKTFSIYILSWPFQAITEIILNRVFMLHWYVIIPSMFFVGLFVPLLILCIYGKMKHHPKIINLLIGLS